MLEYENLKSFIKLILCLKKANFCISEVQKREPASYKTQLIRIMATTTLSLL